MSRIRAAQAANDALNELGIDQARPVDPFEAIENVGLVLRFWPLEDLLGVILPGDPGGVLINNDRPAPLQRYTAAHELGHWYLDQDVLSVDTDEAIRGHHHDPRELDAQTFAAHFLMPLELLYPTAHRYGIRRGREVRPEDVYQVARDMHVSYEAAVRHLTVARIVSAADRDELLRVRPSVIKQRLTGGLALPHARGDVWVLDNPDAEAVVEAFVGDAIVLRLVERPSTGYRWCSETPKAPATVHQLRPAPARFDSARAFATQDPSHVGEVLPLPTAAVQSPVLSPLRDEVVREGFLPDTTRVGGPVTRLVVYEAGTPGLESIHLREVRPFQPDAVVGTLSVSTVVRGAPDVEFRRRLLEAFVEQEARLNESGE